MFVCRSRFVSGLVRDRERRHDEARERVRVAKLGHERFDVRLCELSVERSHRSRYTPTTTMALAGRLSEWGRRWSFKREGELRSRAGSTEQTRRRDIAPRRLLGDFRRRRVSG